MVAHAVEGQVLLVEERARRLERGVAELGETFQGELTPGQQVSTGRFQVVLEVLLGVV